MTDLERVKNELDKVRSEVNSLRGRIAMQDGAIKAIADKEAENRGMIVTLGNRIRQ